MENLPISQDHPAFGSNHAAYVFLDGSGDEPRLLLVEAPNHWAVFLMEKILEKDRKVNPTCRSMVVARDSRNVGLHSKLVTELSYPDFLVEKVEPCRILESPVTVKAFLHSLSKEEREDVNRRMKKMVALERRGPSAAPEAPKALPAPSNLRLLPAASPDPSVAHQNKKDRLESALSGLGFKKRQISAWMKNLRPENLDTPVEILLKNGITELTAA